MAHRAFATMNISVVGNSQLSEQLALGFINAGHTVLLAGKSEIEYPFPTLGKLQLTDIESAGICGDLVFVTAPPSQVRELAYWLGDVRSKVIIDMSSNCRETTTAYFNTAKAIASITGAKHVAKALNLYGYEAVFKPFFGGQSYQLLLAGDSVKAKMIAGIMMRELGVTACYDFGDSESIRLFDEFARCCGNIVASR